ncbi:MAG: hypothetical protein GXX91_10160 [Verrucomicrobiaceae bacterium]|nr:hypothetical protein [Verrucomicrobiaceae bacterium]
MDPTTANPFLEDVFVDHPANLPGVGRIHHQVFSRVLDSLESLLSDSASHHTSGVGRIFLITAPEAGYGKSHLVARLRDHLGAIATTVVLPFDRSRPVTWPVVLSSVLRQFSGSDRSRPHSVPLIDEVSRFFLSRLVLGALANGTVKERECPEAAARMRSDFASLFARDSPSKILNWVDKRSHDLVRLVDPDFSRKLGMGRSELGFWTHVFVDFNLREENALDRLRGLSNGEARERLLQLLRLTTDYRPVMIVADGLDGFFASESAGMDIADIVNGVRENVSRSVTLVCLNEDVWHSLFETRLPSAWRDRLTTETARLNALPPELAADLVRIRLRRTALSESAANRFIQRLGDDHLWDDAGTSLSPRGVLRQAGALWSTEAANYLREPVAVEEKTVTPPVSIDEPLGLPADEIESFASLQEERPHIAAADPLPPTPPPCRQDPERSAASPVPPASPAAAREPVPETPFPDISPRIRESDLAGIDSIIKDIRGSGKTVMSESPGTPSSESPPLSPVSAPQPQPAQPQPAAATRPTREAAGTTASPVSPPLRPDTREPVTPTFGFPAPFIDSDAPTDTPPAPARRTRPLTRATLEQILTQREKEFLSGPALTLNLERLEGFIRTVGRQHAALGQQEERYPSSRSCCLRWNVRGQSVLTGFESPRNSYFWNHLLQQSLASNRQEKIAAFSHHSEPFDPALFSRFGFSPAVIRAHIDIIEMNDRELAMLYAADLTLREFAATTETEKATQLITLHLDPLWRRMIQPL